MKPLFGVVILPLICLCIMILTAFVVVFALRRGTRSINREIEEITSQPDVDTSANTRWARGEVDGKPIVRSAEIQIKACSSCGGENEIGNLTCSYCRRNL